MQTFAMIVTAEPYYSVSQPSDVVVLENRVGSGTIGRVEEVNASYELLPRNEFTYDTGAAATTSAGKLLPRDQYDAVLAMYQAQNAIQIAESKGAQRYAPDRIARARALYEQARGYPDRLSKDIVSLAREAAQIAEDSRAIAVQRAADERAAAEQLRAEQAHRQAEEAQAAAVRAQQAQIEADRAVPRPPQQNVSTGSRQPSETLPASTASEGPAVEVDGTQFQRDQPQAAANRRRILAALQGRFDVVDSGRGIVVTLPEKNAISPALPSYLRPLVEAIRPYPDLHVEVDGNSAAPDFALTQRQADLVRNALMRSGETGDRIVARGLGNSRPRTSNASATGRAQNSRVEIVITGDAIGLLPTWDRTYALAPRR